VKPLSKMPSLRGKRETNRDEKGGKNRIRDSNTKGGIKGREKGTTSSLPRNRRKKNRTVRRPFVENPDWLKKGVKLREERLQRGICHFEETIKLDRRPASVKGLPLGTSGN